MKMKYRKALYNNSELLRDNSNFGVIIQQIALTIGWLYAIKNLARHTYVSSNLIKRRIQ